MHSRKLELVTNNVTTNKNSNEIILKTFSSIDLKPDAVLANSVSGSYSTITKEEKDNGVLVLDIGAGTTDISVFFQGTNIYNDVIPVGGNQFSNDLSLALDIPFSEAEKIKIELFEYLSKNKSKFIIGKAFPARASILIHYFSFLKDYLQFIAEQPTSLKLNHFIPGTSLEIKSSNLLLKNKPDIMIIFAWHMFDVILEKWKQKGLNKTTFVSPLPKLRICK